MLYSGTQAQQVLPQMQLQTGRTKQSPETRGTQQAPAALGKETSPWPTLSEGKPQPPGLEKQDTTYLPGQGCHAGEDRTLEAVATGGADCSEPPPGDLGQGKPARHRWGRGQQVLLKGAGVRSLKPGCGRELPVWGRSRAAARCIKEGLAVASWCFTETTGSAQAGSQKLEFL